MAPPKLTPDKNTLERWQEEGLTHKQMADRVFETTGHRVTREAITLAMMSYGMSKSRPRYKETVPWRVSMDHIVAHPVRMLRLLGRRDHGGELSPEEAEGLDAWLEKLTKENLIVGYDPADDQGFIYIDAGFKDHSGDAPIRKKPLNLKKSKNTAQ